MSPDATDYANEETGLIGGSKSSTIAASMKDPPGATIGGLQVLAVAIIYSMFTYRDAEEYFTTYA